MSAIIPRQGMHSPNDHSANQHRCFALRRVNGSVAGRYSFCTTTKVKTLCFAARILSVSCFVAGVPPRHWFSRIIVFALLLRVTKHCYMYNYLWIFVFIDKFRSLTHAFKSTVQLQNWWLRPWCVVIIWSGYQLYDATVASILVWCWKSMKLHAFLTPVIIQAVVIWTVCQLYAALVVSIVVWCWKFFKSQVFLSPALLQANAME